MIGYLHPVGPPCVVVEHGFLSGDIMAVDFSERLIDLVAGLGETAVYVDDPRLVDV